MPVAGLAWPMFQMSELIFQTALQKKPSEKIKYEKMMSKPDYPVTPAVRVLRQHKIPFEALVYEYEACGGTSQIAALYGLREHRIIKTIVLQNEKKQGLVVLMHGDKQVSTRNLARRLGMKHIEPADPQQAQKWTGYLVGGISPFGMKTALPVYVEKTVWDLADIYVNGGKRGFVVKIRAQGLKVLNPHTVEAAV